MAISENGLIHELLGSPLAESLFETLGSLDVPDGSADVLAGLFGEPRRGKGGMVNTFPFGTPTDQIYPEFVGVCKGDDSIESVLNAASKHCDRTLRQLDPDVSKTVIVVTDKWKEPAFREKYARVFLRHSLVQNVLFVFLLITDDGVSQIPFSPRSRNEINSLHRRGYTVDQLVPKTEVERFLDMLDGRPVYISVERFELNEFEGEKLHEQRNYTLYPSTRKCEVTKRECSKRKDSHHTVRQDRLMEFSSEAAKLMDLPEGGFYFVGKGNPQPGQEFTVWSVRLPFREFAWDSLSAADSNCPPWVETAQRAVSEIVDSVKIK